MTEKQIEKQILQWLNLQPKTFAFKINTVGIYDPKRNIYRKNLNPFVVKGTSDILGVRNGIFFAIEVKRPRAKRLTTGQTAFLMKVVENGGLGICATSLAQVQAWMSLCFPLHQSVVPFQKA
jgi:penicillin-binding protein-related factor A (putative recombinase)